MTIRDNERHAGEVFVALFRSKNAAPGEVESPPLVQEVGAGRARKSEPTPTRKQAEALRRQRVTKTYTKKEARVEASRSARGDRLKAMQARDNTPEKALMRNYIDARRNIGEFLLPGMVVILAATFLYQVMPQVSVIATAVMYVFIGLVLVDAFLMWRGFRKLLAKRLPRASSKGLLFYGVNRAIQIRRFRIPPPQVKRGEKI